MISSAFFGPFSQRFGMDPWILPAMAILESTWNPTARSPGGDLGLMQFNSNPGSSSEGSMVDWAANRGFDVWDPAQATEAAGTLYTDNYARLKAKYPAKPDAELKLAAVAAHNVGVNRVYDRQGNMTPNAQSYVRAVQSKAKPTMLAQAGVSDVPQGYQSPQMNQPAQPAPQGVPQMDYPNMLGFGQQGDWLDQLARDPFVTMGLSILGNRGNVARGALDAFGFRSQMQDRDAQQQQARAVWEAQQQRAQMVAAQMEEDRQRRMAQTQWAATLPAHLQQLAAIAPNQVVAAQLAAGQQQAGPSPMLANPNYRAIASEFDLSKYQPDSVKQAVEVGDPGVLKERLGFGDVMAQRERFQKQLSPLRAAAQASSQINELVQQEGAFSDVATVYSLIKFLDPESVVREGEVSLMQTAMPIYDRLNTFVKRITDGGMVGPTLRKDITETMRRLNTLYSRNAQKLNAEISGIATQYGVDPSMWTGSPIEFPQFNDPLGIR